MPLSLTDDAPTKFPTPDFLTLDSFKRGVITVVDKSRTPKNALIQADNLFLVEDGQPATRPGLDWFGSALPNVPLSTAITYPTAARASSGWSGTGNIFAIDAVYSTITAGTGILFGTKFGFNIPTDATITGVEYIITGNAPSATLSQRQCNVQTTFDNATVVGTSTTLTLNQTTDTTQTLGSSSTFVGGVTLTPAQVNTTNFGVTVRAIASDGQQRKIDAVAVKIYYTRPLPIDGVDYFDSGTGLHLVVASGGTIFRSTDDGVTWTACTGGSYTAGSTANMNQNGAFLYITTGVDTMLRYDGTTTLQTYVALTTPAAPTAAATGLVGTTYTVYYKIAAVNKVGFSIASTALSKAVGIPRSGWDATTNYLTLTLPAPQATQERADIYYSEDNVNFYYLDSIVSSTAVPNVTYKDDGSAIVVPSTLAPTGNTSLGPKVSVLRNVGSRMFGVGDPDNRYRIWFTGTGAFSGAFSSAYDGGYLDWQPGGKEIPVDVEDYRDGKGSPLATIWCNSADGQGAILQMTLDTLTIQDISITVPSAYKLPGSRGTPAPGSVVNVLNDYMYYNSQAFYNLGNSRNMPVPILSTDEASANIRPTIKQVNTAAESGIASVYSDAKVLFSVPDGSTINNVTHLYDTERKAWITNAFTVGFKKFLKYTSTTAGVKARRLLAVKPGDNRLTEISDSIRGDYGKAFLTTMLTGLYPTTKNRFEHQFTEEAEFELSQAQGKIQVEVLGIDRSKGYSSIKTVTLNLAATVNTVGWDTVGWDTKPWDDTSVRSSTSLYTESSTKKYTAIQRELNAIQWHISSNTVDSRYIVRTLQSWGTPTQGGKPAPWRVR